MLLQPLAYLLGCVFRLLARYFQEGEHHEREAALKLAFGLLQLHHALGHVLPVQGLDGLLGLQAYCLFNVHVFIAFCYCFLFL